MACHCFLMMPSPKSMVTYHQLDLQEWPSVKFESKCKYFHSRTYIWKCCLQNVSHFVQNGLPYFWSCVQWHWRCMWTSMGSIFTNSFILMEQIPLNFYSNIQTAKSFCTLHDSTAVVPCAKAFSDYFVPNGMAGIDSNFKCPSNFASWQKKTLVS